MAAVHVRDANCDVACPVCTLLCVSVCASVWLCELDRALRVEYGERRGAGAGSQCFRTSRVRCAPKQNLHAWYSTVVSMRHGVASRGLMLPHMAHVASDGAHSWLHAGRRDAMRSSAMHCYVDSQRC